MHISFVEYLQCPKTKEPLILANVDKRDGEFIFEGRLDSSKYQYPIIRGIPRFISHDSKNYANSFGYQWKRWSRVQFESENINTPMTGHTLSMFERIVGHKGNYAGKTILDVGCGPGRFIDIIRMTKGKAIGIDYSDAVEAAQSNFIGDKNVLICQADALNIPVKPQSVDGAFSIGVLHHTPDPKNGFNEMVKTVKGGGWVAVAVYGKGGYYDSIRVTVWRKIFRVLQPVFGNYPALIYSVIGAYFMYPLTKLPVIGHLLRLVYPTVRLKDRRWRLLDTFDSVTPTYQSSHESYEVFKWFKEAELCCIEPSDWSFTSYNAMVPPKEKC